MASILIKGTDTPIRCDVELSSSAGARAATARWVDGEQIWVDYPSDHGDALLPGTEYVLRAEASPLGPLRTAVRVASVFFTVDPRGQPVRSVRLELCGLDDVSRQALCQRLKAHRPIVVFFGPTHLARDAADREAFQVLEPRDETQLLKMLEEQDVAVLVFSPDLVPAEARRLLLRVRTQLPGLSTANVVLCAGPQTDLFQSFVDEDRIFYLTSGPVEATALRSLLDAAVRHFEAKRRAAPSAGQDDAVSDTELDFCARLCVQVELVEAGALLVEAVQTLLEAEAARCLTYDRDEEVLRPIGRSAAEAPAESVAAGLVGFVARTGQPVALEAVGADVRYDAAADTPDAGRDVRLAAQPVFGPRREVIAVLTAVRSASAPAFSSADEQTLERLASYAAPTLSVMLAQVRTQALLLERSQSVRGDSETYRQEALAHYVGRWNRDGGLLKTLPRWMTSLQWGLLALFLVGVVALGLARHRQYASGPAVIRARHRIGLHAPSPGRVQALAVAPGERVKVGDVVAEIAVATDASSLRSEKVRAPATGIVKDVRVRLDQRVVLGDPIADIVDEEAGYEVVALLPGVHAPALRLGMPVTLQLRGYPDARETAAIAQVGATVVDFAEAARSAGLADPGPSMDMGSVVIVRSALSKPTFSAGGKWHSYHDGMQGRGEVVVGEEPMVVGIVPGLRALVAGQ
jgi:hypothetical protein